VRPAAISGTQRTRGNPKDTKSKRGHQAQPITR
jgi:hypothetical protein